jgi:hypothetical protein
MEKDAVVTTVPRMTDPTICEMVDIVMIVSMAQNFSTGCFVARFTAAAAAEQTPFVTVASVGWRIVL